MGHIACCVDSPDRKETENYLLKSILKSPDTFEAPGSPQSLLFGSRTTSPSPIGFEFQNRLRPYSFPDDVILIRNDAFGKDFTTVRNLPSFQLNVSTFELECRITRNKYLCRTIDYNNERVFQDAYDEIQILKRLSH